MGVFLYFSSLISDKNSQLAICLLLVIIICYSQTSNAQKSLVSAPPNDTLYFNFNQDISTQLLPFEELTKLAVANSPLVKYENQISISESAVYQQAKTQILHTASGFVNYSTGNQGIIPTTKSAPDAIGQISNGYRVGVSLQISLQDIFGRKHQLQQARSNYDAAVIRKEVIQLQVKRELITVYQDLLTAQRILKVRLQDEQNALAALRVAEIELQQRKIEPNELANISNRYTTIKSSAEQVKGELLKSFYQLEALVGVPIQQLKRN